MDVVIREPRSDDVEAVGRMHHAAWREAYAHLLPPEYWDGDGESRRIKQWRYVIEQHPDGVITRIAVRDGHVVGLAGSGPAEPGGGGQTPVRDRSIWIYLLASEHGSGLAGALLDAVQPAGTPAELWVFEANPRARAFYEKHGFRADGARHVFGPELGNQPEIRMVR